MPTTILSLKRERSIDSSASDIDSDDEKDVSPQPVISSSFLHQMEKLRHKAALMRIPSRALTSISQNDIGRVIPIEYLNLIELNKHFRDRVERESLSDKDKASILKQIERHDRLQLHEMEEGRDELLAAKLSLLIMAGRRDKATEEADNAINTHPLNARAYLMKGLVLQAASHLNQARSAIDSALKLHAENGSLKNWHAEAVAVLNEIEQKKNARRKSVRTV